MAPKAHARLKVQPLVVEVQHQVVPEVLVTVEVQTVTPVDQAAAQV
jgi:hypothetical protein